MAEVADWTNPWQPPPGVSAVWTFCSLQEGTQTVFTQASWWTED